MFFPHAAAAAVGLTCSSSQCRARVGHSLWTSTTITTHRGHPHKHHNAHQNPGTSGVGVEGLAYDDPSYPHPGVHEGGTASSTAPGCVLATLLPLLVAAGTLGSLLLPQEAAGYPRDLLREAAGHLRDLPRETAGHTKDLPRETAGHTQDLPRETAGHTKDLPRETVGHTKDLPRDDEKNC
ncbi:uncharacterized protein [Panulirus ornatus]|uniref:uncharacterized protein n=1 Tax=Panulirus ornatus TaxID=150431 RepID=UPI003A886A14